MQKINPTSSQLDGFKRNEEQNQILGRDDLIYTKVDSPTEIPPDIQHNIERNILDSVADSQPGTSNKSDDITWNDMFDTGLFVPKPGNLILENDIINDSQAFETNLDYRKYQSDKQVEKTKDTKKSKQANPKTVKRKNMFKEDDKNPKNGKNTFDQSDAKTKFRKEKYTKTIKSWLEHVNKNSSDDVVHTEMNALKYVKDTVNVNDESIKMADKVVELNESKETSKKKVVQARLANKDGRMKYTKPNTNY
jgi:hypothetical protein